jgi:hypothetical protein
LNYLYFLKKHIIYDVLFYGSGAGIRTQDRSINSRLLYR